MTFLPTVHGSRVRTAGGGGFVRLVAFGSNQYLSLVIGTIDWRRSLVIPASPARLR